MSTLEASILLFVIGSVAGFFNVLAGSGSSLKLPALIFLGLDTLVANGTNRVAVLAQNISAVHSFKRENYSDATLSFKLTLITWPGAIVGAIAAIEISHEIFETIPGVVMIGVTIILLIPMPKQNEANSETEVHTLPMYLSMLFIWFYGAFLQVGVGFLLMFDLVRVNMHEVFIVLIFTIPAVILFILTDNINWTMTIALSLGNAFDAWCSVKISALAICVILLFSKAFFFNCFRRFSQL